MCVWLCFYFLSLFNVLFVVCAFSYFLFACAYIIVLFSADIGRKNYFILTVSILFSLHILTFIQ